ncbi:MAG: hypothetical protein ACE5G0_09990 [Rhodothermales bacterium]
MSSPSQNMVREGRFAFRDPWLLFATIRLFADRLELSGWHLCGRYHRCIPIEQVLRVDLLDHDGLRIRLSVGETVCLRIDRALRWKEAIEAEVYLRRYKARAAGRHLRRL